MNCTCLGRSHFSGTVALWIIPSAKTAFAAENWVLQQKMQCSAACWHFCLPLSIYTHTHTHTYIYIYIYPRGIKRWPFNFFLIISVHWRRNWWRKISGDTKTPFTLSISSLTTSGIFVCDTSKFPQLWQGVRRVTVLSSQTSSLLPRLSSVRLIRTCESTIRHGVNTSLTATA